MGKNIFDSGSEEQRASQERKLYQAKLPNYSVSTSTLVDHIVAFLVGFGAGFAVMYIFYKVVLVSVIGGAISGGVNIFLAQQNAIEKRRMRFRLQFFDLMEAMSVSMRAGNPVFKALQSAREDLVLIYPESSDIIVELDIILGRFNNGIPLSKSFADLAERTGLEDVASFASVYSTIDGKSSRADEIIRETQQIIADKMEIEMEIDTLMTAAKSEVNIMLVMPLVILGVIGYAGAGFMDAIYNTTVGVLVATGGLIVFIISFFMARAFSNVKI